MIEQTKLNVGPKRLLTLIIASTILLYFIFAPGITPSYYAGENFRYAFGSIHQRCQADDGFGFMLTLGRPIQAYMDCLNFKIANTFERMVIVRLFSVGLMGVGMGLLAEYFIELGFAFWTAFLMAGCFFLTPRLYDDSIITAATSLPAAVMFVLLAYMCVNKAHTQKNKIRWIGSSAILLLCALLAYPAMAFFFCSLVMAKLLFSKLADWSRTRNEVGREGILFITVCIVYFIWGYYNMHFHALAPVPEQYHLDRPNLNIIEIAKRFAMLWNVSSGVWTLLPTGNMVAQGWAMLVLLSGGILAGIISFLRSQFYTQNKKQAFIILGQAIAGVVVFFIPSSAFSLIIPKRDMGLRLFYGVAASELTVAFWSIARICMIFPAFFKKAVAFFLVGFLFLIEGYDANLSVSLIASNFEKKVEFVSTAINNHLLKDPVLRRIHFILVRGDYPYNRFFLANGGLMKTLGKHNYSIKWCSLPREILENESDHQNEAIACINSLPKKGIGVTYSYQNELFQRTGHMLVIDNKENKI